MLRRSIAAAWLVAFAFLISDVGAAQRKRPLDEHGYASMGPLAGEATVEKDQVPVAAVFGTEQSRGYVSIDLPLFLGKVKRLELRMKEDDGPNAGQVAPESAKIVSCQLLSAFDSGEQDGKQPKEDCAAPVDGRRSKRGLWTFDLTRFAQSWAEGEPNHGVSLRFGSRKTSQNWRVVFDAKASSGVLVAESNEGGGELAGPDPLSQPPPPAGGGTAFGTAPVTSGQGAGLPPADGPLTGGGTADLPPLDNEAAPQSQTPLPAADAAPVASADPAEQEEAFRLPLASLVLAPALAGAVGFALRSPRFAHLLDPTSALGANSASATEKKGAVP